MSLYACCVCSPVPLFLVSPSLCVALLLLLLLLIEKRTALCLNREAPKVAGVITDDKGESSDEDGGILMVDSNANSTSDSIGGGGAGSTDGLRLGARAGASEVLVLLVGEGICACLPLEETLPPTPTHQEFGGPADKRRAEGPLIDEKAVRKEVLSSSFSYLSLICVCVCARVCRDPS